MHHQGYRTPGLSSPGQHVAAHATSGALDPTPLPPPLQRRCRSADPGCCFFLPSISGNKKNQRKCTIILLKHNSLVLCANKNGHKFSGAVPGCAGAPDCHLPLRGEADDPILCLQLIPVATPSPLPLSTFIQSPLRFVLKDAAHALHPCHPMLHPPCHPPCLPWPWNGCFVASFQPHDVITNLQALMTA